MKHQNLLYLGIASLLLSIGLIDISLLVLNSIALFTGSIFLLVVSILFIFFVATFDMFKMDSEMDFDALEKQGLHIVNCPKCDKRNVLEDQYCYYCGEKLVEDDGY